MDLIKILLIIAGTLSLILGLAGIVIPGLPTTPFLLLTAGLYLRGSDKLYNKFMEYKLINRYISNYRKNKGMTKRNKISVILLMWTMITVSCVFFIPADIAKIIVVVAGLTGTYVMGKVVPTVESININNNNHT